jgi:hypothetical protein
VRKFADRCGQSQRNLTEAIRSVNRCNGKTAGGWQTNVEHRCKTASGGTLKNVTFFGVMVLTRAEATDYIRATTRAAPLLAALRFTLGSLDESRDKVRSGERLFRVVTGSKGRAPNDALPDPSGLVSGSLTSE